MNCAEVTAPIDPLNARNEAPLMVTWRQVADYLINEYSPSVLDGGNTLVVGFQTSWGRTQLVYILGRDLSHVTLFSRVGKVHQINAEQLFTLTGKSLFDILRAGELYVVRHVIPLATFDVGLFEGDMRRAVQEADQQEMALGLGDPDVTATMEHARLIFTGLAAA